MHSKKKTLVRFKVCFHSKRLNVKLRWSKNLRFWNAERDGACDRQSDSQSRKRSWTFRSENGSNLRPQRRSLFLNAISQILKKGTNPTACRYSGVQEQQTSVIEEPGFQKAAYPCASFAYKDRTPAALITLFHVLFVTAFRVPHWLPNLKEKAFKILRLPFLKQK